LLAGFFFGFRLALEFVDCYRRFVQHFCSPLLARSRVNGGGLSYFLKALQVLFCLRKPSRCPVVVTKLDFISGGKAALATVAVLLMVELVRHHSTSLQGIPIPFLP
jgi:hypothetical protein